MNYPVFVQSIQALQDGVGELVNQRQAKALEVVPLDEFLDVHDQHI